MHLILNGIPFVIYSTNAAIAIAPTLIEPGKETTKFRVYATAEDNDDNTTNNSSSTTNNNSSSTTTIHNGPRNGKSSWAQGVRKHYELMRTHQTYAFVERMEKKWLTFDKAKLTIKEAFALLDDYVDSADPDINLPNLVHLLQTAESIRAAGKPEWLQIIGLVHDMGKIMFNWGTPADGQGKRVDEPQYALGGDTFVVGCALPDAAMVLPEFNKLNPDMENPLYNTPNGIYTPGCGIMNLKYAFGHDEYMYRMILHNHCDKNFPPEALAILRLHSFYPWHTGNAYKQFEQPGDEKYLTAIRDFNQFDLYSKASEIPDVEKLWPYYQSLIDKYLPGKLDW